MAGSPRGWLGCDLPRQQVSHQSARTLTRKWVRPANGNLVAGEYSAGRSISGDLGRRAGDAYLNKVPDGDRGDGFLRGVNQCLQRARAAIFLIAVVQREGHRIGREQKSADGRKRYSRRRKPG